MAGWHLSGILKMLNARAKKRRQQAADIDVAADRNCEAMSQAKAVLEEETAKCRPEQPTAQPHPGSGRGILPRRAISSG